MIRAEDDDMAQKKKTVSMSKLILPAYRKFWHWKGRYLVCKGSRGSGKSYAASFKMLMYIMEHPLANGLVIRQVAETLRDSSWATLKQCANMMGVLDYWKFTKSPLEATYLPTGQKILFRGMDDPYKITSIQVDHGYLTTVLVEEAYQIKDPSAFEVVEFSIRGKLPGPESPDYDPGLYKQFIIIFNPWAECWLKTQFFDVVDPDILAMTTTYKDNPELGPEDVARYESYYITAPKRAKVVCDGEWGVSEGLVYENWEMADWFDPVDMLKLHPELQPIYGLDFGYAVSYTAFVAALINMQTHEIWVFDELYERGLVNVEIAKRITEMGYGKERIVADSAEPKSIFDLAQGIIEEIPTPDPDQPNEYIRWRLPNIQGIHKTTIEFGINLMQGFKIWVHPRCKNIMYELNNYSFDVDKDGKYTGKPIKDFDHALDALRYPVTEVALSGRGAMYEVKGGMPSPVGSPMVAMASRTEKPLNPIVTADKGDMPRAIPPTAGGKRVFGPKPSQVRRV